MCGTTPAAHTPTDPNAHSAGYCRVPLPSYSLSTSVSYSGKNYNCPVVMWVKGINRYKGTSCNACQIMCIQWKSDSKAHITILFHITCQSDFSILHRLLTAFFNFPSCHILHTAHVPVPDKSRSLQFPGS